MTTDQEQDSSAGYKSPPKEKQFQRGRSGNPKGRPKGSKNNKTVFEDLAATLIDGKLPGGEENISIREGVVAKLVSKALSGDTRSMNKFIDTMQTYDDENKGYCRQAELAAMHLILEIYRIAQLNAGVSFKPHEVKVIAAYLKAVNDEFKKFEPQIIVMFDKNNFARPEILDENDDGIRGGD